MLQQVSFSGDMGKGLEGRGLGRKEIRKKKKAKNLNLIREDAHTTAIKVRDKWDAVESRGKGGKFQTWLRFQLFNKRAYIPA